MIEILLEYYRKSDGATKKKIPGCIFAEKLVLEKGPPSLKLRRIKEELQPIEGRFDVTSIVTAILKYLFEKYLKSVTMFNLVMKNKP